MNLVPDHFLFLKSVIAEASVFVQNAVFISAVLIADGTVSFHRFSRTSCNDITTNFSS